MKKKHHFDKIADLIADELSTRDPDEDLRTPQASKETPYSTQWFEIGRCKGYGPPYKHMTSRIVVYRRGDLVDWFRKRAELWRKSHAVTV